jgi:hypothetical protein
MEASTRAVLARASSSGSPPSSSQGERKKKCLSAIESVVAGVRKTEAYCRARDAGNPNFETEGELVTAFAHEQARHQNLKALSSEGTWEDR